MSQQESSPSQGYALFPQADLAALTTFRVPARARVLAELYQAEALGEMLAMEGIADANACFVLGGGSNVLFTRDYSGAVLRIATRGIDAVDERDEFARLRIAAGENWDSLVRWTLAQGLAGLENLILIPGTVGAAPIQNIGAYGVELAEFVVVVEARDGERNDFVRLGRDECGFAYRDSRFKHEPGRFIVTAVELELPRERELRLDYSGVRAELEAMGVAAPGHGDVARAVERLRLRKLPNPTEIGNAGSFFKNPLVARERAQALKTDYPELPVYPTDDADRVKLSAAWLIEAAGFKGWRDGAVGVSEKHALVLVNHGGATGADILALAEHIRMAVSRRFGLTLEPEPKIL
ncbi:MAG: UDP-N-acetylmuramate dehydrogenase [Gammaproteobacteria bacterium]